MASYKMRVGETYGRTGGDSSSQQEGEAVGRESEE